MILFNNNISNITCSLLSGLLMFCLGCRPDYAPDEDLAGQLPEKIDFNFHIKPLLSDRCFSCHGPDKNAVKANFQLHSPAGALEQPLSSGQRAFVPGNLRQSEAFQRIISLDLEKQMPPPEFERKLSDYEIALIAKWIEQGAQYEPHWAFTPPEEPELPIVENPSWPQDTIDYFILKTLETRSLQPKKAAGKEILIRRVTLDLTGLPPTPAEIDEFLEDQSRNAFEKVVDRLLASPHFGERMALAWLDLARYADSNGYSQDGLRLMWPWRDWVIRAFNNNMPYDQFIRWQLAGDRFPEATEEQRLATGFLRNHRLNGEGGIIDEEYRVEYVADRTETAATVFLGITMQCARCHDHKYDPVSQEEYYQFFSFFNSVHESGIAANDINSGPEVVLKPKEIAERIAFIDRAIAEQEAAAEEMTDQISPSEYEEPQIDLNQGLIVDLSFDNIRDDKLTNLANLREFYEVPASVEEVEGAQGKAVKFTAFELITIPDEALSFDRADPFSISCYLKLEEAHNFVSVLSHLGSSTINYPGYELAIVEGYPMIRLAHSLPANVIEVRSTRKLTPGTWTHLTFTYDGSGKAAGIELYRNGEKAAIDIRFDKLTQGLSGQRQSLTIGGKIGYQTDTDGSGIIDELKIHQRCLSSIEAAALYRPGEKSYPEIEKKKHFLASSYRPYRTIQKEIRELRKEKFQTEDTLISVMVMEDLPEPRPTFVLNRGVYDAPGRQVYPGTPASILPFPADSQADRLDLADWLFDEQHPLTSRVAVNRFWQLLFGRGIVKTSEDFGNQGALPSHPELLDWLAIRFQTTGWDVKALLKRIVLSATYRQSSRAEAGERAADPDNQWLARGPSGRLSSELIRDVSLSAAGLLSEKIGGPSVKPYQPAGLWEEKGEFSRLKNYEQDHGEQLYRRGLYTFWRRTSPPPSMTIFDAPSRDICTVNRQATNTPLQALVLLNDPQFVEAARVLAERLIREQSGNKERIVNAYRRLTGQRPKVETLSLLLELEEKERLKFEKQPALARRLLEVGEYPVDTTLPATTVASMTVVCSTIMSFDECLMKR